MMIKKTDSNGSVTDNPRDSGQELQDGEDIYEDPVRLLGQEMGFYIPGTCKNRATVYPFSMAACVRNFTIDEQSIMEQSLMMSQHTTQQDLNTRLIESIPGGNTALMSRIMAKGASPNATCRQGNVSACHLAAMYDNDALELLLTKGADSSRSDRQGRTPLHLAAWTGNVKHIAVLLNFPEALRKSVVDHVLSPETLKAVSRHSLPVNELINVPCRRRRNGWSALPNEQCNGVEYNCRKIKEILGGCCSRLVPMFQEGLTPLHAASGRAHHHCVQLLLAAGADPSAQDVHSRTALDYAGGAYYLDHKSIDVNNFVETVGLLLKAGGKILQSSEGAPNNTPLHVAVELGSEAAVKQLLHAGASPTVWNRQGLTAMHVCVQKRNKELLQLLANHNSSNNTSLVPVDVKDRTGSTVLCAAVEAKWIQGVCTALDAGASIAAKANGKSPMHIAAQWGNIVILQKILNVAQDRNINYSNEERSTALLNAISYNHQDVLELLLKNGFSIDIVNSDDSNVFHIATKLGRKKILAFLLGCDNNITNKLINMCDRFGPPLYYAIQNNHPDCAALLISKGAQVDVLCDDDGRGYRRSTLLHAAATKNRCKIAEMIIGNDSKTVHATSGGPLWTPLHEACHKGNREMIVLLLRQGADLSGDCNAEMKSHLQLMNPIQLLLTEVSKPTELIQEVFDSCISSQENVDCSITDNRITVDYTVLNPPCENVERSQMRVIQALLDSGNTYDQQRLLLHPLVESFLFLQWKSSLPFFYSLLALHMCFVLSLNVFTLSLFWCKDRKVEPKSYILYFVIFLMYLSISIITMQEIIFIKQKGIRKLRCMETWLRFLSTLLASILPVIVSWDSESQAEWVRLFSATTLFFSWVKIMLLVSRFPKFGYYVLMYEQVARRVMIILVPLGCLIIGFSVSFMIQFHAQPPFEDLWSSLLMTIVMMSEPGYKDTVNKDHESASLIMLRLIFVASFFLCSIVLMNMLVSVAVNDVKDLEVLGHKKRLEKQVEFITAFEGTAPRNFVKKILPKRLYEKWFEFMQVENGIQNFRGGSVSGYLCWYRLPIRLREAFFEKAQSQKKRLDTNQDTNMYHMKLNEIQKVIVKNDTRILEAVNRMFEEICKLRRENADKLSLSKDEGTAI